MKYVLFVLIGLCAILSVSAGIMARFKNPYKLYYIIGLKGAGKTTYMVKNMLKYVKAGKTVYTNIPHVYIPGVRVFDSKLLSSFVPEPDSVLFVDEAGLVWDNREYKSFSSGLTQFFALQRQYKLTVYMNSQSLDVDKKIRDRIDVMYVMSNIMDCIGVIRRVKCKIVAYPGTSQSEGKIGIDYEIAGISGLKLTFLPRYRKWFKSFAPPLREAIPYDEIVSELSLHPVKDWFHRIIHKRIRPVHSDSDDGVVL